MKKSLLTLLGLGLAVGAFAQAVPSPSWTTLQNTNFPHPSAGLILMDVVDANTVWGVGNYGSNGKFSNLYTKTINGGTNWSTGPVFPNDTNTYVIANIDGVSSTVAWSAAYKKLNGDSGAVYKTTDGGTNWTNGGNASMFTHASSFANWVVFTSPNDGVCMGDANPNANNEHEIWRTTDAGATWTLVPAANIPNPLGGEFGLTNSYTSLGNTIWFGTNAGRVFRSTDAGVTWSVSAAMAGVSEVTDIAFTDQNTGLCFGRSGTTTNLWRSLNGGLNWVNVGAPPSLGFNSLAPITGTQWFASASNNSTTISYSKDFGNTWNSWGGSGIGYLTIGFADNATGWAGTFSDASAVGGVYKYSSSVPLGVEQSSNFVPTAIHTYPNPSNGNITVTLPSSKHSSLEIVVIDALGNVVYSEKASTVTVEKRSLDLKHLAKGVYFLNINTSSEKLFQKIIIE